MRKDIELYLKGVNDSSTSILLEGPKGLSQEQDAIELAAALLNTEPSRLQIHPDYLYISCGKTKSIGVELAEEIIQKAGYIPSKAAHIVTVISEMDRMTVQAQNKLLKLIEESDSFILIGTVYSSNILDTIKSRVRIISYKPLPANQFNAFCMENGIQNADILYHLTNGCPGLAGSDDMTHLFDRISSIITSGSWLELMPVLHLVEEKDPEHFFIKNRIHVKGLYTLILSKIMQQAKKAVIPDFTKLLFLLEEHLMACDLPSYTKDNFFYCIACIIETGYTCKSHVHYAV